MRYRRFGKTLRNNAGKIASVAVATAGLIFGLRRRRAMRAEENHTPRKRRS